jgi:diacylglycerol kinase (ATP)
LAVVQGDPPEPEEPSGRGPVVELFLNPGSGSYSAARIRALSDAFAARGVTVTQTICGTGVPVIAENIDHVCIAGGDGTVREIVTAVARSGRSIDLSIYPMGTINLLAREGVYPTDPELFVDRLLSGERRSHFPVKVGDGLFFVCASVGPDSHAVARLSPGLKRRIGRLAYVIAFWPLLFSWPRQPIRLSVDGERLDCEAFYLAKGRYFAGPWSFAREARVDRPMLHLVAFARMRRRDLVAFAWALLWRRPVERLEGVTCLPCVALSADSDAPLPVQADGDIVASLPVDIRLAETVLRFR